MADRQAVQDTLVEAITSLAKQAGEARVAAHALQLAQAAQALATTHKELNLL